jgi:hypothetical protein
MSAPAGAVRGRETRGRSGGDSVTITKLSPERFASAPQIGMAITQDWHSLLRWLTWPTYADSKRAAGAWCPCVLEGGAVKGGRGPMSLLAFDVDDCTAGAIDHSAAALAPYAGAIIPTFSATPQKPKHRIVLLPSRSLTAAEFAVAWPQMVRVLAACGIVVDRSCKNLNRLYFACVARSASDWLGARVLSGAAVDVHAMLAAARQLADVERQRRDDQARARRPVRDEHHDRYVARAIERARGNIAGAPEGGRHGALLRESFSLARFGLSETQIADALLDAFVDAAGEARRTEGVRAIRDAVAARGRTGAG